MAVYKVIQDIEAEDKLLGPLTLKGFIYAIIALFLLFINVRIAIGGLGGGYRFIVIFVLALPMILFGVLASPLGGEQPTEVWLLSHIRFLVKPRIRLWNQLGLANMLTITAPKKVERQLAKKLTQREVHSRLEALAMTMDSRGWAVKNVYSDATSLSTPLGYLRGNQDDSDRLVQPEPPEANPISDIHPSEDILDTQNNMKARQMDDLMQQKAIEMKEIRLARMDAIKRGVITPQTMAPVAKEAPHISARHDALYTEQQLKGIKPVEKATVNLKNADLAKNSRDISIESVSKIANFEGGPQPTRIAPGEVEVSFH